MTDENEQPEEAVEPSPLIELILLLNYLKSRFDANLYIEIARTRTTDWRILVRDKPLEDAGEILVDDQGYDLHLISDAARSELEKLFLVNSNDFEESVDEFTPNDFEQMENLISEVQEKIDNEHYTFFELLTVGPVMWKLTIKDRLYDGVILFAREGDSPLLGGSLHCNPSTPKPFENKKEAGLHQKYFVQRVDGKPIPDGCIVLEWSDPNARAGIKAFSDAVRNDGYDALADDLDRRLKAYD